MSIGTPVAISGLPTGPTGGTLTTTADAPAGSLIVLILFDNSAATNLSAITCSDNHSAGTYVRAVSSYSTPTAAIGSLGIMYALNTAVDLPLGSVLTLAGTNSSLANIGAFAISGCNGGLDKALADVKATGVLTISETTGVLAARDEFMITAMNFAGAVSTYTEDTNFTNIISGTSGGAEAYRIVSSTASVTYAPSWTPSNTLSFSMATFKISVVQGFNYETRSQGRSMVFIAARAMHPLRDDPVVLGPKPSMWEPFPQFARKHTAPTRAWARLDEQFMPTWNAVLIPTLQSWELPIQFVKSLFGQSKSQPDVPSFVATPLPAQLIAQGAPRLMGQSKSQPDVPSFVAAPVVQQPYGFDVIAQGAPRLMWQPKTQSETPSFIPQLSILDSIIQFTSRLLSRRPQTENPIVIPVTAAPRADLELFPRRLITTEHTIPIDLVVPTTPVAPTIAFDREQFPARLEYIPRVQQFESFVIVIASQILQLTLVAWKWVAQTPSLAFTLTGSLVAWIWKAQAAVLAQTMIVALKAWIWKPFAALLANTITATHVVWKWLPQSALLAFSLGFGAPGVVWRWLAQAPSFFFPVTLIAAQAVWLWVGRALAGGTHFAKVTYGLLLQVGRLRNR